MTRYLLDTNICIFMLKNRYGVAERIKKAEVVAFEDLGPEALLKLEVEDFPTICVIDSLGRCPYSLS